MLGRGNKSWAFRLVPAWLATRGNLHSTLPATRGFETHNLTVSWKLGEFEFERVPEVISLELWCCRQSTSFLQKAPAAAWKRSPSLIYVKQSQKRFWGRKKSACGSREDLTKPDICQQISETPFWPKKQRLQQPGSAHQA